MSLFAEDGKIRVALKTLTPNFKRFEVRFDGGRWNVSDDTFIWNIHAGQNQVEARTLNKFGVAGPISSGVLEVATNAGSGNP